MDGNTNVDTATKTQPLPNAKTESLAGSRPPPKAASDPEPHPKAKSLCQSNVESNSERNVPLAADTKPAGPHLPNTEAAGALASKSAETLPSPAARRQTDTDPGAQEAKAAGNPAKTPLDLTPKLVERVHALYEELGRQDVMAVQELERAQKLMKETSRD